MNAQRTFPLSPLQLFAVPVTRNHPGPPFLVLLSPHGHELVDGHEAGPVASSQAEQRRLPVQRALAGLGRETKGTESMGSMCVCVCVRGRQRRRRTEIDVLIAAGVVQ